MAKYYLLSDGRKIGIDGSAKSVEDLHKWAQENNIGLSEYYKYETKKGNIINVPRWSVERARALDYPDMQGAVNISDREDKQVLGKLFNRVASGELTVKNPLGKGKDITRTVAEPDALKVVRYEPPVKKEEPKKEEPSLPMYLQEPLNNFQAVERDIQDLSVSRPPDDYPNELAIWKKDWDATVNRAGLYEEQYLSRATGLTKAQREYKEEQKDWAEKYPLLAMLYQLPLGFNSLFERTASLPHMGNPNADTSHGWGYARSEGMMEGLAEAGQGWRDWGAGFYSLGHYLPMTVATLMAVAAPPTALGTVPVIGLTIPQAVTATTLILGAASATSDEWRKMYMNDGFLSTKEQIAGTMKGVIESATEYLGEAFQVKTFYNAYKLGGRAGLDTAVKQAVTKALYPTLAQYAKAGVLMEVSELGEELASEIGSIVTDNVVLGIPAPGPEEMKQRLRDIAVQTFYGTILQGGALQALTVSQSAIQARKLNALSDAKLGWSSPKIALDAINQLKELDFTTSRETAIKAAKQLVTKDAAMNPKAKQVVNQAIANVIDATNQYDVLTAQNLYLEEKAVRKEVEELSWRQAQLERGEQTPQAEQRVSDLEYLIEDANTRLETILQKEMENEQQTEILGIMREGNKLEQKARKSNKQALAKLAKTEEYKNATAEEKVAMATKVGQENYKANTLYDKAETKYKDAALYKLRQTAEYKQAEPEAQAQMEEAELQRQQEARDADIEAAEQEAISEQQEAEKTSQTQPTEATEDNEVVPDIIDQLEAKKAALRQERQDINKELNEYRKLMDQQGGWLPSVTPEQKKAYHEVKKRQKEVNRKLNEVGIEIRKEKAARKKAEREAQKPKKKVDKKDTKKDTAEEKEKEAAKEQGVSIYDELIELGNKREAEATAPHSFGRNEFNIKLGLLKDAIKQRNHALVLRYASDIFAILEVSIPTTIKGVLNPEVYENDAVINRILDGYARSLLDQEIIDYVAEVVKGVLAQGEKPVLIRTNDGRYSDPVGNSDAVITEGVRRGLVAANKEGWIEIKGQTAPAAIDKSPRTEKKPEPKKKVDKKDTKKDIAESEDKDGQKDKERTPGNQRQDTKSDEQQRDDRSESAGTGQADRQGGQDEGGEAGAEEKPKQRKTYVKTKSGGKTRVFEATRIDGEWIYYVNERGTESRTKRNPRTQTTNDPLVYRKWKSEHANRSRGAQRAAQKRDRRLTMSQKVLDSMPNLAALQGRVFPPGEAGDFKNVFIPGYGPLCRESKNDQEWTYDTIYENSIPTSEGAQASRDADYKPILEAAEKELDRWYDGRQTKDTDYWDEAQKAQEEIEYYEKELDKATTEEERQLIRQKLTELDGRVFDDYTEAEQMEMEEAESDEVILNDQGYPASWDEAGTDTRTKSEALQETLPTIPDKTADDALLGMVKSHILSIIRKDRTTTVNFRDGRQLVINHITQEAMMTEAGKTGVMYAGRTQGEKGKNVYKAIVDLVDGLNQGNRTLFHESFHVVWKLFLNSEQISYINQYYRVKGNKGELVRKYVVTRQGTEMALYWTKEQFNALNRERQAEALEEGAAYGFEHWLGSRTDTAPTTMIGKLWQRLADAIRHALVKLNLASQNAKLTDIFHAVASDKLTGQGERGDGQRHMLSNAYHGSGAFFDRFDVDFVGTGEGAQAFGWGIYVTEREGVAKDYADKLGTDENIQHLSPDEMTKYFDDIGLGEDGYYEYKANRHFGGKYTGDPMSGGGTISLQNNYAETINNIMRGIERMEWQKNNSQEYYDKNKDKLVWWKTMLNTIESNKDKYPETYTPSNHNLYTVDVWENRQEDVLEWEKKTKPEHIKKILAQAKKESIDIDYQRNDLYIKDPKTGWHTTTALYNKDLYRGLSEALGSAKAASKFLLRAGIDGIKYPVNALSGGKGEKGYNYVVFDADQIQIKDHTRYKPVPTAAEVAEAERQYAEVEAKYRGKTYYRATTPGDTRKIKTDRSDWDQWLFVSQKRESVKYYGDQVSEVTIKPSANTLREGTSQFARIFGSDKKYISAPNKYLDWLADGTNKAKDAGYDVVEFERDSDVGTVILNKDIVGVGDQWLKAPSGKPTNLNERQWVQVRTQAFKDWFGDWEKDPAKYRVLLDNNGEPLQLYHGGTVDNVFDTTGKTSVGAFFTPSREGAEYYAYNAGEKVGEYFISPGKILNLTNENVLREWWNKQDGDSWFGISIDDVVGLLDSGSLYQDDMGRTQNAILDQARKDGYDTVIFQDATSGQVENSYVKFAPNQIKSATANVGTFDSENPDIRYKKLDPILEQALDDLERERFGRSKPATPSRTATSTLPPEEKREERPQPTTTRPPNQNKSQRPGQNKPPTEAEIDALSERIGRDLGIVPAQVKEKLGRQIIAAWREAEGDVSRLMENAAIRNFGEWVEKNKPEGTNNRDLIWHWEEMLEYAEKAGLSQQQISEMAKSDRFDATAIGINLFQQMNYTGKMLVETEATLSDRSWGTPQERELMERQYGILQAKFDELQAAYTRQASEAGTVLWTRRQNKAEYLQNLVEASKATESKINRAALELDDMRRELDELERAISDLEKSFDLLLQVMDSRKYKEYGDMTGEELEAEKQRQAERIQDMKNRANHLLYAIEQKIETMQADQARQTETQAQMRKMRQSGRKARVIDIVERKPDVHDWFRAAWYNAVLAGPMTHTINMTANIINSVLEDVITLMSNPAAAGPQVAEQMRALFQKDGAFAKAKQEFRSPNEFHRKNQVILKGNKLFQGIQFSTKLLGAEDMLAFFPNERGMLKSLAVWESRETGRSVADLMENPTAEMLAQAHYEAKRNTFNQNPEGYVGVLIGAIEKFYSTLDQSGPGGKALGNLIRANFIPFTRVLGNVLNSTIDYTPLGLIRYYAYKSENPDSLLNKQRKNANGQALWKDENGEPIVSPYRMRDAKRQAARVAFGTILGSLLYALTMISDDDDEDKWFISGAGPRDYKKYKQLMLSGWRPYSLHIGKYIISYKEWPLSGALSVIGNLHDIQKYDGKNKPQDWVDQTIYAAMGVASSFLDRSFASTAISAITALDRGDPKWVKRSLTGMTTSSLIPYNNMFRFIENVYNRDVYTPETIGQQIWSSTPLMPKKGLPRRVNVFGVYEQKDPVTARLAMSDNVGLVVPDIKKTREIFKLVRKNNLWLSETNKRELRVDRYVGKRGVAEGDKKYIWLDATDTEKIRVLRGTEYVRLLNEGSNYNRIKKYDKNGDKDKLSALLSKLGKEATAYATEEVLNEYRRNDKMQKKYTTYNKSKEEE